MPRDLMHDVTPGVTRDMTRDLLRQSQSQSQSQKPIPTSHGRQLARSFDCLNYRPRARKTDKAMNTTTNHAHGASAGASTRALGLKVGDKVVVTFTRRDYGPEGIAGFSPDEYELVEVPS